MRSDSPASLFLWKLFHLYFLEKTPRAALEWLASMYDEHLELPSRLEPVLLKYWASSDALVFEEAARIAVRGFYFEPARQILLVALLVEHALLEIDEALSLLTRQGITQESLPDVHAHAVEVVWLMNQDKRLSFLGPKNYSLLHDALRDVVSNFGVAKIKTTGLTPGSDPKV